MGFMNTYITKFNKCKILVVGDLMIDEYLWGDVDRISPEAPVQVVSVKNENYTLGGSGNVVNNLVELGAKVSVIGITGTDRHGNLLLKKLNEIGVDTTGVIHDPDRPTTRKTRIIAANQHVLRIDRETKRKISAKTFELLAGFIEKKVSSADLVLISDYGKGLITNSLLSKLIESAEKHKKITIADPKGLDFSKYSGVSRVVSSSSLMPVFLATFIHISGTRTPSRSEQTIYIFSPICSQLQSPEDVACLYYSPQRYPEHC